MEILSPPQKRHRPNTEDDFEGSARIPTFVTKGESFDSKELMEVFDKFQIAFLPDIAKTSDGQSFGALTWKDLHGIYKSLAKSDKDSWCIETGSESDEKPKWEEFLDSQTKKHSTAYCSFLVQKDKDVFAKTSEQLPLQRFSWNTWDHEPCLWFFFGRNYSKSQLQGRPEHTDSISHDGTWHYQLSGSKIWLLRPTVKLLEHMKKMLSNNQFSCWEKCPQLRVNCEEGDVIIVNTRLWKHQTQIPPQSVPSVSYARDFWTKKSTEIKNADMKNIDGLYASNDIEAGTIIFKEVDMPDCELHRSSNPNCDIVELEDGSGAVVSSRAITAGEFFCVPNSSDEEEDEDDDGYSDFDCEQS